MTSLLTVAEVAERLRCSISNVYNLVAQGRLKCYRVGAGNAGLRFADDHIRDFLKMSEAAGKSALPEPPEYVR
jgi:excisionase family DNA binding protein